MQAACVWLCLLAGVSGDTLAWPQDAELSAHPLERALAADCADGRLDSHPLLRAALLAAGETDLANIAQFEEQFEILATKLAEKLTVTGAPLDLPLGTVAVGRLELRAGPSSLSASARN